MATNTTNFDLKKPAYTDTADIMDINGNMDKVDSSLNGLGKGLAIISKNNTHAAITTGQYVYVHGHGSLAEGLYTAKSNIAANAALSTSNLTADSSGGLNALNGKSLNKTTKTGTTSAGGNININMGVEQYDIISASYVGGIAIPYKANAYEWLVHVTDTSLVPVASTSVSLEIIYTNKLP